jgi:nitrate reductase gamma subunit
VFVVDAFATTFPEGVSTISTISATEEVFTLAVVSVEGRSAVRVLAGEICLTLRRITSRRLATWTCLSMSDDSNNGGTGFRNSFSAFVSRFFDRGTSYSV